ncbi:DMT family transporter [Thiofilum flexile]|uniref:DMT family transporter n=1 Tax=Thiofilum flexile TaxID=125627 RepID=UPI0003AAC500|nr:DMT family transporter [Thiofilum flexile]
MKHLPILAFWLLGFIWGSNFIYMKQASVLILPEQIVLLRVLFGFVPVLTYALLIGALQRRHLRYAHHFLVMSVLATAAYYYGFAKGTALLPSGIAGALSGSIPIFALLLALLFIPNERATWQRVLGLVAGFSGVLLIADPFSADLGGGKAAGVLYMVLGSLSLGASFIYAKKYLSPLGIAPAALTTYQLGLALPILGFFTRLEGIGNILQSPQATWGLIIGLGLLGTGLAYLIYYYIVDKLGAVTAASATYIPPVVALAIGAIIVGEPITAKDYLAAILIFIAVILISMKTRPVTLPVAAKVAD